MANFVLLASSCIVLVLHWIFVLCVILTLQFHHITWLVGLVNVLYQISLLWYKNGARFVPRVLDRHSCDSPVFDTACTDITELCMYLGYTSLAEVLALFPGLIVVMLYVLPESVVGLCTTCDPQKPWSTMYTLHLTVFKLWCIQWNPSITDTIGDQHLSLIARCP